MKYLLRTPGARPHRNAVLFSALAFAILGCNHDSTAPAATGTKLVFTTQPTTSIVDSTLTTAPVVAVEDANGNVVTGASNVVTLTITANPGNATFVGIYNVTTVLGLATFSHVSLSQPGTGYTVTATSAALTPATSVPFDMVYEANGSFASITMGGSSACGVATTGVGYCWGSNTSGQLGNGAVLPSSSPLKISGGLAFGSVGPGSLQNYSCGLTTAGAAYCWGYNDYGQLGNGSLATSSTPVAVTGNLVFTSLSVGLDGHACGLVSGGAAYCWGYNIAGQIGSATVAFSSTPLAVPGGLSFTSISAGQNGTTCGVTTGGAAYCWGYNADGELGNGGTANSSAPVAVSGGHLFANVSVGYNSVCGVASALGTGYCWGDNTYGQLGNGSTTGSKTPFSVPGIQFSTISAGDGFACGLVVNGAPIGTAYCWGYNGLGQLGTGTTKANATPIAIFGGLRFASISAGYSSTCAVTPGGAGYCWGDNTFGELGNASTVESITPVLVSTPPPQ